MNTNGRKLAILVLGCLTLVSFLAIRVEAIGSYVQELPFKGSYQVTCTYHTECTEPRTAGFGLDFTDDYGRTLGDVVYAAGRGTVTRTESVPATWGQTIVLSHPDLYRSRYAHLQEYFPSLNHKMGAGSPIGYMGDTGNATGPHLHFQVYDNTDTGQGVDPVPIDGVTTAFCEDDCIYTNSSFNTDVRVVDNYGDPGFRLTTTTASCTNNRVSGYSKLGSASRTYFFRHCNGVIGSPTATGTWNVKLGSTGSYIVYIFGPTHNGLAFTNDARYKIFSNGVLLETISIAQHAYKNKWVRLGVFYFGSLSNNYVQLTNQTGDAGSVAFDAVMFVKNY